MISSQLHVVTSLGAEETQWSRGMGLLNEVDEAIFGAIFCGYL